MSEELSAAQLRQQSERLQALKSDLERLVTESEGAEAVELDQSRQGRLSRMDAMQQQAMAVAQQATYQRQLREVLKAQARLEAGDYGYCTLCDDPIPLARLHIRPEAELCLACQSKGEGG